MLQYFETLQDTSGNALVGATVTVTAYPGGGAAAIYSTNGTAAPILNSIAIADVTGQVSFFVPDGAFILTYKQAGTVYKIKSPVQMIDPIAFTAFTDTGAANAYVVNASALPLTLYTGLKLEFIAANSNTGPSTLNLNAIGVQPIIVAGGSAVGAGQIPAGGIIRVEWDGAHFQIVGSTSSPLYVQTAQELAAGVTPTVLQNPPGTVIPGSVTRYGATGNPAAENAKPIFANALAANPNETTFIVGQYRFDTSGVSITTGSPIGLVGEGAGAGPGTLSNAYCSQILPNFAGGTDVIYVGPSLFGSIFRDFQINSNVGQRTAGAGIKLDATGLNSVVSNYRINNVAFNNQFNCFQTQQGGIGTVENSFFFSWKQDAIHSAGDGVHEGLTGFIERNYFFGDTSFGTAQNSCLAINNGYGRVLNNELLGSQIAVRAQVGEFPSGAFEVVSNWIEENDIGGIQASQTGTTAASMHAYNWNEFSTGVSGISRANWQSHISVVAGNAPTWFSDFQIIGNRMRSSSTNAASNWINVQGGTRGMIRYNLLEAQAGNAGNGITIGVAASVTGTDCLDNMVVGPFANPYIINNNLVMFRDFSSQLTAAQVNSLTVSDGSSAWVTDGTAGSNPLVGGGTGTIAYRERGAWKGKRPENTGVQIVTGASYTLTDQDVQITCTFAGAMTLTLPPVASNFGRAILFRSTVAQTVSSASANVQPLAGGANSTAILAATAGKFAYLVSDGSQWNIMMAN